MFCLHQTLLFAIGCAKGGGPILGQGGARGNCSRCSIRDYLTALLRHPGQSVTTLWYFCDINTRPLPTRGPFHARCAKTLALVLIFTHNGPKPSYFRTFIQAVCQRTLEHHSHWTKILSLLADFKLRRFLNAPGTLATTIGFMKNLGFTT